MFFRVICLWTYTKGAKNMDHAHFGAAAGTVEYRHFHLFCGLGGGAKGFNRATARLGSLRAKLRCIGGIDSDAAAIRDFSRLAGVPGTVMDLFTREQYLAFHGAEPPPGWREATPEDLRRAAGAERPHIIFTSPPCKGFSGLLSESRSKTAKYRALNELTLRGIWLALEAWKDDPPEYFLLENVPRIENRGAGLLDQIVRLLQGFGYVARLTKHDCGELGGLAQSRKRFLLVARHRAKVPVCLYVPEKRPLRAVGSVLEKMPMPGTALAGPMHRMPSLQWRTWVRLAFVEAGKDWRSLKRLRVENGVLRDYGIVPVSRETPHNGTFGVVPWQKPMGTVTGNGRPATGGFSVADPRPVDHDTYKQTKYRVTRYDETAGTVISASTTGNGAFAVSDPRYNWGAGTHINKMAVLPYDESCKTVTGSDRVGSGALAVADPRPRNADGRSFSSHGVTPWDAPSATVAGEGHPSNGRFAVADPRVDGHEKSIQLGVRRWEDPAGTVTGQYWPGQGPFSVADPRPNLDRDKGSDYLTGGHYGVVRWSEAAGAVSAAGQHDNGRWSVADPRALEGEAVSALPALDDRLVAVIQAEDGTWHRPFTTLELAAIQSLVDPEEYLELEGLSDAAWRERIGNAVPPEAAQAIGSAIAESMLAAQNGEGFMLSTREIWVRDLRIALAMDAPDLPAW